MYPGNNLETEGQLPTPIFGDLLMDLYFCAFSGQNRDFFIFKHFNFLSFRFVFMQQAGRVLKSFGVKSYKLLLIIHFLTQDALNLGFLFVFFSLI